MESYKNEDDFEVEQKHVNFVASTATEFGEMYVDFEQIMRELLINSTDESFKSKVSAMLTRHEVYKAVHDTITKWRTQESAGAMFNNLLDAIGRINPDYRRRLYDARKIIKGEGSMRKVPEPKDTAVSQELSATLPGYSQQVNPYPTTDELNVTTEMIPAEPPMPDGRLSTQGLEEENIQNPAYELRQPLLKQEYIVVEVPDQLKVDNRNDTKPQGRSAWKSWKFCILVVVVTIAFVPSSIVNSFGSKKNPSDGPPSNVSTNGPHTGIFHTEDIDTYNSTQTLISTSTPAMTQPLKREQESIHHVVADYSSLNYDCKSTPVLVYISSSADPVQNWFLSCDNSSLWNLTLQGNISFEQVNQIFDTNLQNSLRILEFKGNHFCKEFHFSGCTNRPIFVNLIEISLAGIKSECTHLFKYLSECVNFIKRFKVSMQDMHILPRGVSALDALRLKSGNPIDFINVTGTTRDIKAGRK